MIFYLMNVVTALYTLYGNRYTALSLGCVVSHHSFCHAVDSTVCGLRARSGEGRVDSLLYPFEIEYSRERAKVQRRVTDSVRRV